MTELPTTQAGPGRPAQRHARRTASSRSASTCATAARTALTVQPSTATDLEHGFAAVSKFFVPGKVALAELETELFTRLGSRDVFDDEYISSGGQLHELIAGHDRFVADLRPLVDPDAFACHPYDVCTAMLLEEAGGVVTDPHGAPLDAPLDTTTPVAWAGYANVELAARIGPILAELVDDLRASVARPAASTSWAASPTTRVHACWRWRPTSRRR